MADDSDKLRGDIARTKASLNETVSRLETLVRKDLRDAKETLEDTIGTVSSTIKIFNVAAQVRKRPLLMTGGSLVSGALLTAMLNRPREVPVLSAPMTLPQEPAGPSLIETIAAKYPDEVRILKGIAFSFFVKLIAKQARERMPHYDDAISDVERRIKEGLEKTRYPEPNR